MHAGEGSGETLEPLPMLKGVLGELETDFGQRMVNGTRGNGFKVTEGVFSWDIGKEFFLEVRPGTSCPEKLWKLGRGELEKPVLVEDGRGTEIRGAVRSLSSPND